MSDAFLWYCTLHRWLAALAAPVGSLEVVDHTHTWWQLIGQYLPVCRLGPQVSAGWVPSWQYHQELLTIAWFVYFSGRKWSILPIKQQRAQFSCYFAHFKATSGVSMSISKNAYIRLKLQKNVVSSKILLGPNLHCLGDPTCTLTVRNRGPNLHPGKCWPMSWHHLWVWSTTTWDPTGAAKAANPRCIVLYWITLLTGTWKYKTKTGVSFSCRRYLDIHDRNLQWYRSKFLWPNFGCLI